MLGTTSISNFRFFSNVGIFSYILWGILRMGPKLMLHTIFRHTAWRYFIQYFYCMYTLTTTKHEVKVWNLLYAMSLQRSNRWILQHTQCHSGFQGFWIRDIVNSIYKQDYQVKNASFKTFVTIYFSNKGKSKEPLKMVRQASLYQRGHGIQTKKL